MRRRFLIPAVLALVASAVIPLSSVGAATTCDGRTATLVGTPGNDNLRGTSGDDVIVGLGGNDRIDGAGGHDIICGDGGDDTLLGRRGSDVLLGGEGDDLLKGGSGSDDLQGDAGSDRIAPGTGNDTIDGGSGTDTALYNSSKLGVRIDLAAGVVTGSGNDDIASVEAVRGSRYSDLIYGSGSADRLDGWRGDDRIIGQGGNDTLIGGGGRDQLDGGPGNDIANGGSGQDGCSAETSSGCESDSTASAIFVSTDGSDANNGSSEDRAYRTIKKALRNAPSGVTVWVLPGVYHEGIFIERLGRAGSGTTTVAGVGGRPILDGDNSRSLGIFCERCTNVVFEGLEVREFTDIGLGATLSSGVTIRNNHVHHNGAAVQLNGWGLEGYGIHVDDSDNVLIDRNRVHDNGPNPPVFPNRLLGTGINTYNLTDVVISNNRSYRNHGGGILVEDSVDVLVEGNDVYENDLDATVDDWWDGGLWLDGGHDVIVRDNQFHDHNGPGIEISDEDNQNPTGYVLIDNVSTDNLFGVYVWNFGTRDWPADSIISLSGNDFTGNTDRDVWIAARG